MRAPHRTTPPSHTPAARGRYYPRAAQQKNDILALCPDAVVEMGPGRASSFEVTVNSMLAFSKLAARVFPNFKGLAAQIAEFAGTGRAPPEWK